MNEAKPAQPPAGQPASVATSPASPDELRADIKQTRAQLGETVEALARKTDVKARTQHQAVTAFQLWLRQARQLADRGSQQAGAAAGRLETAAARLLPPTASDPLRSRRAAQRAAAGAAVLTAVAGVITGWISLRNRRS